MLSTKGSYWKSVERKIVCESIKLIKSSRECAETVAWGCYIKGCF